MSPEVNVPTLLADAREGCRHARNRLVARASELARRVAWARGYVDVEDVVQNTVVRVMESLESLTDPHAFDGWVAAIARNEARMLARGNIRWRQLKFALAVRDPESTRARENPDADESPPRNSLLREAMARLPPSQRDLIHARYVRSESHREMGARLRISTSAVKSRLHRARKRLKEEIGNMNRSTSWRLDPTDVKSLAVAELFRSISKGSPRGVQGILLDRQGYAVATDGAHLLLRRIAALQALDADVLVEPNGAEALTGSAELTVHLDEVRIALATEELAWAISQLRFPDYRQVLPQETDVMMRILVRARDLRSATDGSLPAATRFDDNQVVDYVRLSLLPDGTLVAGAVVYEAGGSGPREMPTSPVELLRVHVAETLADGFIHLRVPREALFALDGVEVSLSVSRHGVVDMTDGKHRVLTMCMKTADKLAAA